MTDINEKLSLKKSTVILIALTVAVVYSFSLIFCVILLKDGKTSFTAYKDSASDTANVSDSSIFSEITSSDSTTSAPSFSSDITSSLTNSDITASGNGSLESGTSSNENSSQNGSSNDTKPIVKSFKNAMWYSFEDLNFVGKDAAAFKQSINKMFDDATTLGCDAVIVQVRPFADALYYSKYFPHSSVLSGTQGVDPGYDALDYMVKAAHERGLQIHAWLNPYRVTLGTADHLTLSDDHIAKKWLTDDNSENDRYVLTWENRLYFNPSIPEVQALILNGVREIVENYDVDGIHIDDYFYPSTTPVGDEFDKPEYDKYVANGGKLSLGDWRRNNVNTLVSGIYRTVKEIDAAVSFGVSPAYNISTDNSDTNYQNKYADLKKWMSTSGYIDYIAPQLYFGYNYPNDSIKYDYLLDLWMSMPRHENVKIYIGLAAYKIGDPSADMESGEWTTVDDILARQAVDADKIGCNGVIIFNYSTIMAEDELTTAQRENLKDVLKP